jgi:hypothetical protein
VVHVGSLEAPAVGDGAAVAEQDVETLVVLGANSRMREATTAKVRDKAAARAPGCFVRLPPRP